MQTIQLDINPSFYSKNPIHLSQYDIMQGGARIELRDAGNPYTIPEGATISIEGSKPDGTAFAYDDKCEIINENTVILSITQQMTAVSGRVVCELRIKQGEDNIGTCNFWLLVEKAPIPDDVDISETEIPAYIDGARQQAEAAAQSAAEAEEWARRSEEWAKEDGVVTFNGRKGDVVPEAGDYTADQITYKTEDVAAALEGLETENKQAQSSISIMQTALTDMAGRIDEAEIDIQNNSDRVNRAQSSISIVASDLAALTDRVEAAEESVTAAQSSISLIDAEVRRITGDLDTAEEDIATLQETSGQLIDQSTILLNQIDQAQEVGVKNIAPLAFGLRSSYVCPVLYKLDDDSVVADSGSDRVRVWNRGNGLISFTFGQGGSSEAVYINDVYFVVSQFSVNQYVHNYDTTFIISPLASSDRITPSEDTYYLSVLYTDREGASKEAIITTDPAELPLRGQVTIRLIRKAQYYTPYTPGRATPDDVIMVRDSRIASDQFAPFALPNWSLSEMLQPMLTGGLGANKLKISTPTGYAGGLLQQEYTPDEDFYGLVTFGAYHKNNYSKPAYAKVTSKLYGYDSSYSFRWLGDGMYVPAGAHSAGDPIQAQRLSFFYPFRKGRAYTIYASNVTYVYIDKLEARGGDQT